MALQERCLLNANDKKDICNGLGASQFSVACTLIGKNDTPIAKTARLLKNRRDIKNNFDLVVFNSIIVFSFKKNFKFF
jgi:hypothetical protein